MEGPLPTSRPPEGMNTHVEQFMLKDANGHELYSQKRVKKNQYCQRGKKVKEIFREVEDA